MIFHISCFFLNLLTQARAATTTQCSCQEHSATTTTAPTGPFCESSGDPCRPNPCEAFIPNYEISFVIARTTTLGHCETLCMEEPGCVALEWDSRSVNCILHPYFIPEDYITYRPGLTVNRYCERSQILPTQPTPTPTTAPIIFTLNPFLDLLFPGNGFHITENAFINLSESELLPFVVETESCARRCLDFRTCSAFTLFNDTCTLYAGDIRTVDYFYVEGSSLNIRCAATLNRR